MNLFSQDKPKADPEKVREIKNWVYRAKPILSTRLNERERESTGRFERIQRALRDL